MPKEICVSIMKLLFLFGSARESVARRDSSVVRGVGTGFGVSASLVTGAGLCVTTDSMGWGGRFGGWLKEISLFLLFSRDWYLGVTDFEGGYKMAK